MDGIIIVITFVFTIFKLSFPHTCLDIVQSREQGDALVVAFGDWLRDVDYCKWWKSLGVEAPSDYVDPDLLFDTLPQP